MAVRVFECDYRFIQANTPSDAAEKSKEIIRQEFENVNAAELVCLLVIEGCHEAL